MLSWFVPSSLCVLLSAQDPKPAPAPAPVSAAPSARVEVPTFHNETCPIMGKKVSLPLFIDTELGRFYVCCKPCYRKVQRDVPGAHKTAYPNVEPHANTRCPVSGEPIGEDAVELVLQGHRFKLCCAGCVDAARARSQTTLIAVAKPKVDDIGNTTCPVTGKPTVANAFVLIDDHLVHLSAPTVVEDVTKDPAAVLDTARTLAKAQPPKTPHVHTKKAEAPARAEPAAGSKENAK